MARRGYTTAIGKIAKVHHDRRRSEIRVFAELLKLEQNSALSSHQLGSFCDGRGVAGPKADQ